MSTTITILDADDWIAVYDGDKQVFEGHEVEPAALLRALNIPVVVIYDADTGPSGTFPARLSEFNGVHNETTGA